jgi:hypothetical protein
MIKGPEEELRDHGRRRQADGEQFEASQKYLRWQDRAANQKFFAGEHAAFSKEAADLLLEAGIIKADPRPDQAGRHALHQVRPRHDRGAYCKPHETSEPVAPGTRVVLGVSFFVLFVAVWAAATFGGFVSKTFLADPLTMVVGLDAAGRAGLRQGHRHDGVARARRLCHRRRAGRAAGRADGRLQAHRGVLRALRELSRATCPPRAFIPLLILWAGIGEAQKLA